MRESIEDLIYKPYIRGLKDVYIIASGASIDFVDKHFFDRKFTIGINLAVKDFYCNIVVYKHIDDFNKIKNYSDFTSHVYSKHDCGNKDSQINYNDGFYFEHQNNGLDVINYPKNENEIIVSWSTITSAMHIAAYLGAKNIILVGHDCGTINGKANYTGYYSHTGGQHPNQSEYKNWLKKIESQTIEVKQWLQKKYGCNIYSLNPFINYNLEGNIYE